MVWVGFNQGVVWMTFSASAPELRQLLPSIDIPDSEINLMLNWGPICYIVAVWAFMFRMAQLGQQAVHECVLWGAALVCAGSVLRMVPLVCLWWPRGWLHLGQVLNGLAGPVSAAVAPAFAAAWFPTEERTLATSLVWTCQSAAPSLGFAAALAVNGPGGLCVLMLLEAASSLLALAAWVLAVPKLPKVAPSHSAAVQRQAGGSAGGIGVLADLAAVLQKNRFWLLAVSGGAAVGAFQCWSASLGVLFSAEAAPGPGSMKTGVLLGLVSNAACFCGTLGAPALAERCFRRHYKGLLLLACGLQMLLFLLFSAVVPSAGGGSPLLEVGWSGMLAVLAAASVVNGLGGPVCFELGAELTYPAPEGISASAYSFTVNGGGFAMMVAVSGGGPLAQGAASCLLMAAVVAASLLLILPVQEAYPRLAFDELGIQGSVPGASELCSD